MKTNISITGLLDVFTVGIKKDKQQALRPTYVLQLYMAHEIAVFDFSNIVLKMYLHETYGEICMHKNW
jgi:hypothetical protein